MPLTHHFITSKQWLAFENIQKKKICKNQTKLSKQRCDICQKHMRTFAVKECGAATPLHSTCCTSPRKCERAQSRVFSSWSQSAGWRCTQAQKALTETLSPHSLLVLLMMSESLFNRLFFFFKHPYLFLNLGVKTRWGKSVQGQFWVSEH